MLTLFLRFCQLCIYTFFCTRGNFFRQMPTRRKVLIYSFSEPDTNESGAIEDTSLSSLKEEQAIYHKQFQETGFCSILYTRPFYRFPSLNSIKLSVGLEAFSFLCSNVLLRLCFTFSFSGIKQKHFHVKSLTLQNKSGEHFPERCIKREGS